LSEVAPGRRFTRAALEKLGSHGWPGNVRELRHLITRTAAINPAEVIDSEDLQLLSWSTPLSDQAMGPMPALITLEEMEKRLIVRTLEQCKGRKEAASVLGIARSTLHVKMKKYDLS